MFVESETILQNDPRSVNFRRNSNTLVILGTAVIVFGLWNIIKVVAYSILGIPIYDLSDLEGVEAEDEQFFMIFIMIILYITLAGDAVVRFIAGHNARAEGLGKKRSKAYLFFLVWEILFGIFTVGSVISEMFASPESFEDYYVSLFMELSSLVILIEVFIAALSVRKYKADNPGRS